MSSERTAKPSIAELSHGGLSRSATMSSPRTRPNASRMEIFSNPKTAVASRTIFCASSSGVSPFMASAAFTIRVLSMLMLWFVADFQQGSALLAESFHLVGDRMVRLGGGRVAIEHGKGLTRVRLHDDVGIERNATEERHA